LLSLLYLPKIYLLSTFIDEEKIYLIMYPPRWMNLALAFGIQVLADNSQHPITDQEVLTSSDCHNAVSFIELKLSKY